MPRQVVVLVLGVPLNARTGAWAQALAALGLQLPKLPAISDLDIAEVLKVEPLVRAHGDFQAGLGRAWSSVHAHGAEDFASENFDAAVDDLAEILDDAFEPGEPWVISDPQLAFALPAWRVVAERKDLDLRAIVPLSHPRDAVATLIDQGGLSREHAYAVWARFMLDAERRTRGLRRAFIPADAVETDWRLAIDDVAGWLQIGLSERLQDEAAASVEGALKGAGTASVTKATATAVNPDAETAVEGFAGVAFDLLERLALEPNSRHYMDKLDDARAGFDAEAARLQGLRPAVERALVDRALFYRHERTERLEAQSHLKGFAKELEKLREIIRRGDGDLEIEQIAHERMRKAQGKWDGERGLEGEAEAERDPAVVLAEEIEKITAESERVHAYSAAVVAEYDKLSHLRSAEAAVFEQVQHDYAMLRSQIFAEGDAIQRLKFENAMMSARLAAEARIRRSLEAEDPAQRVPVRHGDSSNKLFDGLSRSLVCVLDSAAGEGAMSQSQAFVRALAEDLGFALEVIFVGDPAPLDLAVPIHSVGSNPSNVIVAELAATLFSRGFRSAVACSVATGYVAHILKQAGFRVTGLVNESAGWGAATTRSFMQACDRVVFSTEALRASYQRFAPVGEKTAVIHVPITSATASIDPVRRRRARRALRERVGLAAAAKVVISIGSSDQRSGIDLFYEVARAVIRQRNDVDFVWIGDVDPQMEAGLRASAASPDFKGRLTLLPQGDEAQSAALLAGADLYALTSRDNGLPPAVLEALTAGLPVVAFDQTVGAREMIGAGGVVVEGLDIAGMAYAIARHLSASSGDKAGKTRGENDYRRYVMDVAALADPTFRRVSVIVPTANDRTRVEERLQSIAQQTYPIYEVIVIDHGSHDGTLAWLELNLQQVVPSARLQRAAAANSPLMQWRQAVRHATGDCLWMALPAEVAVPEFLAEVLAGFREPGVVVSYAASRTDATEGSLDTWAESLNLEEGAVAIARSLAATNTIATAGAVVADRAALQSALAFLGEDVSGGAIGEWLLWIELMSRGLVASTSAVLNDRHAPPATGSRTASSEEILEAQAYAQIRGSLSEADPRVRDAAWARFVQSEPRSETASAESVVPSPPHLHIPTLSSNPPPVVAPSLAKALATFAQARAEMYGVSPAVHENDFIYRFVVSNLSFATRKAAVDYYFDDGRRSAEQLRAILARSGAKRILEMENPAIFEFASGYACVSRHLPLILPNFEIVPCDIHEEAIAFTRDQIGLDAVLSKQVPEELRLGRTFEVVFALSFFSHMPDRTWGRWLATLYAHTAPGGSLVFTTHGMASRRFLGDPVVNEEGYWFMRDSEQKDLDVDEYGQTVTMPSYVLRQIYKHAPGQLSYFQQGSWWGHQDVYVVTKPKPDPDKARGLPT